MYPCLRWPELTKVHRPSPRLTQTLGATQPQSCYYKVCARRVKFFFSGMYTLRWLPFHKWKHSLDIDYWYMHSIIAHYLSLPYCFYSGINKVFSDDQYCAWRVCIHGHACILKALSGQRAALQDSEAGDQDACLPAISYLVSISSRVWSQLPCTFESVSNPLPARYGCVLITHYTLAYSLLHLDENVSSMTKWC